MKGVLLAPCISFAQCTAELCQNEAECKHMEDPKEPHVVSADRLDGSLIITFEDGRCGVYSSRLLYRLLPLARELQDLPEAEAQGAAEVRGR